MIRRPPRSTLSSSSAASDVYKRQVVDSKVNPVEELMVTKETDPSRLHQRQKQIDLGKGTPEYQEYIKRIPKENRSRKHVRTPDPTQIRSKRAWDGIVKQWRRALHQWAREAGVE
eukprot:TRINITY_DN16931_c0_g1_i7.p1 TRINITY_DN16931_c0_g1~~TRINITY_DN16931_c0_g1_i7.p1  ORF type:complete len:115 (+),score=18.26 TRINITY_DN16931_c0_g1_i7:83-427(+)